MSHRQQALFNRALGDSRNAAELLGEISLFADGRMDAARLREASHHIRAAACALTTLETLLAGNPEPKRGD